MLGSLPALSDLDNTLFWYSLSVPRPVHIHLERALRVLSQSYFQSHCLSWDDGPGPVLLPYLTSIKWFHYVDDARMLTSGCFIDFRKHLMFGE